MPTQIKSNGSLIGLFDPSTIKTSIVVVVISRNTHIPSAEWSVNVQVHIGLVGNIPEGIVMLQRPAEIWALVAIQSPVSWTVEQLPTPLSNSPATILMPPSASVVTLSTITGLGTCWSTGHASQWMSGSPNAPLGTATTKLLLLGPFNTSCSYLISVQQGHQVRILSSSRITDLPTFLHHQGVCSSFFFILSKELKRSLFV